MRGRIVTTDLASAVVLVALAVALVWEFSTRNVTAADTGGLLITSVVFTEPFDHVELTLSLFDQGRLERIFIRRAT